MTSLVGHQDDGDSLVSEGPDEGHDFVAGDRIKSTGGFIGQQNAAIPDDAAGDGYSLTLPSRHLLDVAIN